MSAEELKALVQGDLGAAGLAVWLDRPVSVLELAGQLFVEVVLSDAAYEEAIKRQMSATLARIGLKETSVVVRSVWHLEKVEEPVPAYGPSGGLRAAVVVPVLLKSGRNISEVTVLVTKLAELELNRILGHQVSLSDVAHLVVLNALRRAGQSYWNPQTEDYLEVTGSSAPEISRLLRKTA